MIRKLTTVVMATLALTMTAVGVSTSASAAPSYPDHMVNGDQLIYPVAGPNNEDLVSTNGQYRLDLSSFNAYTTRVSTGLVTWNSGPGTTSTTEQPTKLQMQADGNLVLRSTSTGTALWSTGTTQTGSVNATLTMQGDGNLVLRTVAVGGNGNLGPSTVRWSSWYGKA